MTHRISPEAATSYEVSIPTATRCSCGEAVEVSHDTRGWYARCPRCFDPSAEDASAKALCYGHGETPEAALWAWQDQHDEAHEVEWAPTSDVIGNLARDVGFEAERQRGWTLRRSTTFEALSAGSPIVATCKTWGPPCGP